MKRIFTYSLLLLSLFASSLAMAQMTTCPENIDFEDGNTGIWSYFKGRCCPSGVIRATTATAPISGRHTLVSGTANDVYGGFPVVAPGGGSYSMRLGNNNTGSEAEKARYYVHVPTGVTNYALIYRFAVVLEDPSHSAAQQPRFEVNAYDSTTGSPLPCSQYSYVASSSLPGFTRSSRGSDVYYKPWSTANINLSGLAGTTVIIDFASGDCDAGGHFGYGYIDMTCGLFAISNVACDTSHVELFAPMGYATYSWYDSAAMGTLIDTGQAIVTTCGSPRTFAVILAPYSGYGCPDTLYTHVVPSNLILNKTPDTTLCFSSGLTLTTGASDIVGPLTYQWTSTGAMSCDTCISTYVAPPSTTTYYFTVTNPFGCSQSDSIKVIGNFITLDVVTVNETCFGSRDGSSSIVLTSPPTPLTYSWSTVPTQTTASATGLNAGIYRVVIMDTNGCMGIFYDTVTSPPPAILTFEATAGPTTCSGTDGSITLGGFNPGTTDTIQYRHNGVTYTVVSVANISGYISITNLERGVYDSFSVITTICPFNTLGATTLSDPPYPPYPNASSNGPVCLGDTLLLSSFSAGSGNTYSWSGPGSFTATNQYPIVTGSTYAHAGLYRVTITRANCSVNDSVNVVIKPKPLASASSNTPICSGDGLDLISSSSNGVDHFLWQGPNAFSSVRQSPSIVNADTIASGVYTVTLTLNGCNTTLTTNVIVNGTPTAPVPTDTNYCQFMSAVPLQATGINLTWYADRIAAGTGSATAPTPATTTPGMRSWFVTQTSPAGCVSPASELVVSVSPHPGSSIVISDTAVCLGSPITFSSTHNGEQYTRLQWNFGDGDSIANITPVLHSFSAIGAFVIKLSTDYQVCGHSDVTRLVNVFGNPMVNLGPDTSVCEGGVAITLSDIINAGNPAATMLWSTGETSSSIMVNTHGVYYLKVRIDGCETSDSVVISNGCYIELPNAFTPNGDGINDYFMPRPLASKGLLSFKLEIFNRWGQVVFATSKTEGNGWDGMYNGSVQPQGVYIYLIDATFIDGRKEQFHGNFSLIR